jgi:hypothetical protein
MALSTIAARFETSKAAIAFAVTAKKVLNGAEKGTDVIVSPLIEKMMCAYAVAPSGRIIVVCRQLWKDARSGVFDAPRAPSFVRIDLSRSRQILEVVFLYGMRRKCSGLKMLGPSVVKSSAALSRLRNPSRQSHKTCCSARENISFYGPDTIS